MHEGHRERLRAEYLEHDGNGLPDHRFLELLLTYAIPRKDTNELAHRLLMRFGSLEAVLYAETAQLLAVEGVGESTAVFLHVQGEATRRLMCRRLEDTRGRTQLSKPLLAAKFAIARLGNRAYENAMLVCLNAKRYVEHIEPLQKGVVAEAQIYPRQVAEIALLRRAHSVMLLHNHPSGNPAPSPEDRAVTDSVRAALAAVDVPLIDHIIVGASCAYSFSADVILEVSGDESVSMSVADYETSLSEHRSAVKKIMEAY